MKASIKLAALLFAATLTSLNAYGGLTDIANSPMASSGNTEVKPNLMFILDDSGSMNWDYMPDSVKNNNGRHCFRNSAYNGVYYNPDIHYDLPVNADGTLFPNSTFTAAHTDGFNSGSSTTNLSTNFRTGNDRSNYAAYYYKYTGLSPVTPVPGTCYTDASYTLVTVSTTSGPGLTDERQNFANWYTYYRTRILMMKSAAGLAFKNINNSFRVGFTTISEKGVSSTSTKFLKIADFDSPHKTLWYEKLYGASGRSSTPLRGAMSKAGRLYAGQLLTGADDPVQYSCQQNFTIMSTDGYWNTGSESPSNRSGYRCVTNNSPSTNYGAYRIDNKTCVGQQDGDEVRPMFDGATVRYDKSTSQIRQSKNRITQQTSQILKRTTQIQQSTSRLQQQTTQLQTRTDTLQSRISEINTIVQESDCRRYYNNGTCRNWGNWYDVTSCTEDPENVMCQSYPDIQERQCTRWRDNGTCRHWGNRSYVSSCTADPEHVECQIGLTWSSWTKVSSCTASSTTQCQYVVGPWTGTSSCTPVSPSSGSPYTVGTATECQTVVTSPFSNVSSCTESSTPNGSGNTTQCQYAGWSAWSNVSSCAPVDQSASSPYTVGTAVQCQTTDTGWVGASSCTPSSGGGQTVTCQGPIVTGPTPVSSCTPQTANAGNNWTTTICTTTAIQPETPVASCTAEGPTAANGYVTTSCNTVTTGPTSVSSCVASGPTAANNWTTTTCSNPIFSGGTSDTLADVAEFYWRTDLRTSALGNCTGALGADVCKNNVPGAGNDVNSQQHMTTFTLGLGADGTLAYSPNYLSGGSADFNGIVNGSQDWPDPIPNTSGERIDDLWHAAVDGRGVYYSAKNSTTLVSGLSNALAGVSARKGASAAAATSSLEPVAGDNALYVALYTTVFWDGELEARSIDPATGNVNSAPTWSAQTLLDAKTSDFSDTRTIYTFDSTAANKLKPFLWANLTLAQQTYFSSICLPTALLSQCSSLSLTDQAAVSGANLVNYLRGQRGYGGSLYRHRQHVLGDMVDAKPQYVKAPPFTYVDPGYSDYKSAQANRTPMVYEAANDGMLHAFTAADGQEAWAYIPPMVLGNLYRLADQTYSSSHRYFVDGSPVAGDVCPSTPSSNCSGAQWKTILVGGLNAGGRGYYALDITNPASPKALWNFTSSNDSDLGYTFGNPMIVKRKDGTWVVAVTSGYNNVSPGDGGGHLFILNAYTGQLLEKIDTGVGSTTTPSGLAKINAWFNENTDKTAQRFYGGDMEGNMWRITLDEGSPPASPVSTNATAFLLGQVGQINGAGNQPITTKPDLTVVSYAGTDYNVVEFGTGRYLGLTDLADSSQQSVYAIKDDLSNTGLGLVRTPGTLVEQVLTDVPGVNGARDTRTVTNNPIDWTNKAGWYVDLNPGNTSPGERVNIDVVLNLGILTVAANVPSTNACDVGGYAYLYYFDFKTGSFVSTATDNQVGSRLPDNAMVAGMNVVYITNPVTGTVEAVNVICTTDGVCSTEHPPPTPSGGGNANRFSWRELIQ